MAAIGNIGTSGEVKGQYENMKKFVGGSLFFSSLFIRRDRKMVKGKN